MQVEEKEEVQSNETLYLFIYCGKKVLPLFLQRLICMIMKTVELSSFLTDFTPYLL